MGFGREVECRSLVVIDRGIISLRWDEMVGYRDKRLVCRYRERQIWRGCYMAQKTLSVFSLGGATAR